MRSSYRRSRSESRRSALKTNLIRAFLITSFLATIPASPALAAPCAGSDLQGFTFHDYNADGARSVGNVEAGIEGVVITVFSDDGSSASCETLPSGSFGIDAPTGGFPIRLEATLPAGPLFDDLQPGAAGRTTTIFVSATTSGLDVGFNTPTDYCQANPDVMTTCFLQGDPLVSGSDAAVGDTVISVDYDRTLPKPDHLAFGSEVGAVWGVAYQRSSQSLFVAAVLRRHAGYGPSGLGGIYKLDYSGGDPPAVSSFVDVSSLGIPVGTDPRAQGGEEPPGTGTSNGNGPGLDNLTYQEIGKVGLGDIDVEEGAGRLWVMNLSNGTLYAMDIGPTGTVPTSAMPFPLPVVPCTDGVFRPWAVNSHQGRIYVGGVCSNEQISPYPAPPSQGGFTDFPNLVGYVYSMDSSGGAFSLELTIPLNYQKGCSLTIFGCQWNPWTDLTTATRVLNPSGPRHATPILSDIEFADDGDMIIGFTDRTGFQYGLRSPAPNTSSTDSSVSTVFAGGDMLRAHFDPGAGNWMLESNGVVGGVVGAGSGNGEGLDGGEYYSAKIGVNTHNELSLGGYAVLRGSNHFVGSAMDPLTINSGGLLWMYDRGATPGAKFDGYTLYDNFDPSTFGKGVGIGDVELRCDEAPIEIGNRVWDDLDGDGIQDPGEPGLAGVVVNLTCAGEDGVLGTLDDDPAPPVTTDANGEYLFSSAGGALAPSSECELSIALADAALGGRGATIRDYLLNIGNTDFHDSDGDPLPRPGFVVTRFTNGPAGANDHSLDFGFAEAGVDCLSLTGEVLCATDGSGDFIWTFRIKNLTDDAVHHMYLVQPAGITFEPNYFDFSDEPLGYLRPNRNIPSRPKQVRIKGAQPGQVIAFQLSIHDAEIRECCSVYVTIELPTCDCAQIPRAKDFLTCNYFTPGQYRYGFTLDNLFNIPIEYILLAPIPPPAFTISQDTGRLPDAPVPPNSSTSKAVTINGPPGEEVCFRVSTHDQNLRQCCSIEQCVKLHQCYFEPYPIGDGMFDFTGSTLLISNLGSSGNDGVAFHVGEAGSVDIGWMELEPVASGAAVSLGAAGSIGGIPEQDLGTLRIDDGGGELEITADYTPAGIVSHRVEVYDDGALVIGAEGHQGAVARVSELPAGIGADAFAQAFGLSFVWQDDLVIEIQGYAPVLGDELRVVAEDMQLPVDFLSELRLLAAQIPTITITEASSTGPDSAPTPEPSCVPGAEQLCLNGGRFRVGVEWRDAAGNTGRGQARLLTGDTGYFWFFNEDNVELVVKVLDGRAYNDHWWVFYGALSNVEYTLTVTDTETGFEKAYFNPAGQFASAGDTTAIPAGSGSTSGSVVVEPPASEPVSKGACAAGPEALCLNGQRFEARVSWAKPDGTTGTGTAVPVTGDTGYFWFFDEANVELMIKVLDGRAVNGHWWVFYGALSNVEYTLVVTDSQTGASKSYFNPLGQFASRGDTQAFN